jgi:phosphoribosylformylglycinamidine synthase I
MAAQVGVVVFPGSNCEHDVVEAVQAVGGEGRLLWHGDQSLGGVDAVVLPGGFAHGDYLRPGAIARFSPIMPAVVEFARGGGPVVGVCNGFQVLTESGLLPGALQRNAGLKFLCEPATIRVEAAGTALTSEVAATTPAATTRWPSCAPTNVLSSATSTTPTGRPTTSRVFARPSATSWG